MRKLNRSEAAVVGGGVSPRLIAVNPGGRSTPGTAKNPNTTIIKMTGKPA